MSSSICPQCGTAIDAERVSLGRCPVCLLRLGLEPMSDVDAISTMAVTQTAGPDATPHLRFAPPLPVPDVGTTFGPYHLHRVLGRGGYGLVWEAEHLATHRRVAVKIVTAVRASSRDAVERFEREGRLAASINHPRCVFVFGAEEIDGYPTITMELMAGGTLQDVIDGRGRIPTREAVDCILDVVEGLEAAQAAGVIHRDIKPSNCFVDAAGRVAIGDFGISKTLEPATDLTTVGTFVGTPAYAAPEQARGAEVDFRADMYAVGATLYALLTGSPPFAGTSAADALARVLTEPPPPLASHGVQAPKALEIVIRRLLAKEPSQRYRHYSAVTAALLPFSSGAFTPATLAQRLAAFGVDFVIINTAASALFVSAMPLVLARALQATASPQELEAQFNGATRVLLAWAEFTSLLLYFVVTEWYWGRSFGKWLFDLRVITASGGPIALWQALVRTVVFATPPIVANGAVTGLPAFVRSLLVGSARFIPFLTMRPANGFAGLHELLSGTRVVAVRARERVRVPSVALDAHASAAERRHFGPYRPVAVAWQRDGQALLTARDELLGRDVWIHAFDAASSAPRVEALIAGRPGRLRWLTGVREPAGAWDAYEAPTGSSLRAWIERRGRLSWREARGMLRDVAAELSALESEAPSGRTLSLEHIWVHGAGRALVLDMPSSIGPADEPAFTVSEWPSLLRHFTRFMLEGRADAEDAPPMVPLPGHARAFVDDLWGAHLRSPITRLETGVHSLSATRQQLQVLSLRADGLTRAARLAPLLAFALLLLSVLTAASVETMPRPFEASTPEPIRQWGRFAALWYSHEASAATLDVVERAHLEAYRTLMSHTYAEVEAADLGGRLYLSDDARRWLAAARQQYPAPTAEGLDRARGVVASELSTGPNRVGDGRLNAPAPARESFFYSWLMLVWAVTGLLLAFALRGGLLFRVCGIEVQTGRGEPAGRLRCLLRASVAWSPLFLLSVLVMTVRSERLDPFASAAMLVFLAAGVYAMIRPPRGLPDLVAGTHLMPK